MPRSVDALFCLACGAELAEPLRRRGSLRCHTCREAGAPISFELALLSFELALCRGQATHAFEGAVSDPRPAA
jgi:hypothetical protein